MDVSLIHSTNGQIDTIVVSDHTVWPLPLTLSNRWCDRWCVPRQV